MSIEKEIEVSERRVKRLKRMNRHLAFSLEQRVKNAMICVERDGAQDGLGAFRHMCAIESTAKKYNDNERTISDYMDLIGELREQLEAA
jgi:hypothetical protein